MIDIKVNHKSLYVPEGTEIVYQQQNNAFSPDAMAADIVWTFTLPALPNARLLDHADYLLCSEWRRYAAEVWWDGWLVSSGSLWVESAVQDGEVQCGLTLNEIALGYGDRLLRDNGVWPVYSLGDRLADHFGELDHFLQACAAGETDVRFFPSYAPKWYRNPKEGGWDDMEQKFALVPTLNTEVTTLHGNLQHYALAPAIGLVRMLELSLGGAGFRLAGALKDDERVARLYSQSLNSMDGDALQWELDNRVSVDIDPRQCELADGAGAQSNADDAVPLAFTARGGGPFNRFAPDGRTDEYKVDFHLWADPGFLESGTDTIDGVSWQWQDALFLALTFDKGHWSAVDFPRSQCDAPDLYNYSGYQFGELWFNTAGSLLTCQWLQLTPVNGAVAPDYRQPSGYYAGTARFAPYPGTAADYEASAAVGTSRVCVRLVKRRVYFRTGETTHNGGQYPATFYMIRADGPLYDVPTDGEAEFPVNVHSRSLDLADHVPHMTNSQYLSALAQTLGLCVYVGSHERTVQAEFFKDVFRTGAVDVSEWVTRRERLYQEPTAYTLKFGSLLAQQDVAARRLLDPVDDIWSLGDPFDCRRKSAFVRAQNAYWTSEESDFDADDSQAATPDQREEAVERFRRKGRAWRQTGGDGRTRRFAPDGLNPKEETVAPAVRFTNMAQLKRYRQEHDPAAAYLHELQCQGNSELYDDDYTGEFDLTVVQQCSDGSNRLSPVRLDDGGALPSGSLTLAVEGAESLGELFLAPYYEFLTTAQRCRLELRLPPVKALEVMRLLRPQEGAQTRWLRVDGRRYLPTLIEWHLGPADMAAATVDCLAASAEIG